MSEIIAWMVSNWQVVLGFLGSSLVQGYVFLKKLWKLERDMQEETKERNLQIEHLKQSLEEHKKDGKTMLSEIRGELSSLRKEFTEEWRELRDDIKTLLSRGQN